MAKEGFLGGSNGETETFASLAKSFELSPEFQVIAGWDGIVRRVNPAFTQAFGFSTADLLDRQFAQLCHPDDRDGWQRQVTTAQALGQSSARVACRVRTKGGGYVNASWHVAVDAERRLVFAFGRPVGARAANA